MHLTLEELEKVHIERVLREMGGRVAEASQRLGIPRSTLYQKIKRFSISPPSDPLRPVPSLEERASVGWKPPGRAGPRPAPATTARSGAGPPDGPDRGRRRPHGTGRALSPAVDPRPGRLLVVDDEAAIRFALSEYFRENGWTVDSAAEKEEAEALLACTEYAVVIADLRLTGIYGVEGLDIIQLSRHLRPETRVVLLTGNGTPEIEAEARRRGADAFLHKPLPLPQLEAVVDSLVGAAS